MISMLAVTAAGGLVIAACGGSDDQASPGASPVQSSADTSAAETEMDDPDAAQAALDDAGADVDLEEYADNLSGFNTGEGGGVVTIDGVPWTYTAEVCIAQDLDFIAAGPGESPDGTPAWIDVTASGDFDVDGDGENDRIVDVYVTVGQTGMFGGGSEDDPDYAASSMFSEGLTFTLDGGRISGSGEIEDYNGIAIPYGERRPVTFEAACG
jgi:hypothetical protein